MSAHHPSTPTGRNSFINRKVIWLVRAIGDVVLNGYELAGGSLRINQRLKNACSRLLVSQLKKPTPVGF